uniref:Uncharacterized protein n=1 Tax=Melopsittacus undulatus TaxID=13146 RepID=A0A8V5GLP5_MELUD
MASAVRAGPRLRRAAEGPELAALPRGLRDELQAALGSEGSVVPFRLLRSLHAALRDRDPPARGAGAAAGTPALPCPQNPELVARLERIKARLANEEYRRMTRCDHCQPWSLDSGQVCLRAPCRACCIPQS